MRTMPKANNRKRNLRSNNQTTGARTTKTPRSKQSLIHLPKMLRPIRPTNQQTFLRCKRMTRKEKAWIFEKKGVFSIVRKRHPNQVPLVKKMLRVDPMKVTIIFDNWEESNETSHTSLAHESND